MVDEVMFLSIYKEKIHRKGIFKMEVPSANVFEFG
jgi:hypothetical protein